MGLSMGQPTNQEANGGAFWIHCFVVLEAFNFRNRHQKHAGVCGDSASIYLESVDR